MSDTKIPVAPDAVKHILSFPFLAQSLLVENYSSVSLSILDSMGFGIAGIPPFSQPIFPVKQSHHFMVQSAAVAPVGDGPVSITGYDYRLFPVGTVLTPPAPPPAPPAPSPPFAFKDIFSNRPSTFLIGSNPSTVIVNAQKWIAPIGAPIYSIGSNGEVTCTSGPSLPVLIDDQKSADMTAVLTIDFTNTGPSIIAIDLILNWDSTNTAIASASYVQIRIEVQKSGGSTYEARITLLEVLGGISSQIAQTAGFIAAGGNIPTLRCTCQFRGIAVTISGLIGTTAFSLTGNIDGSLNGLTNTQQGFWEEQTGTGIQVTSCQVNYP